VTADERNSIHGQILNQWEANTTHGSQKSQTIHARGPQDKDHTDEAKHWGIQYVVADMMLQHH
jgi:hypothetical protein